MLDDRMAERLKPKPKAPAQEMDDCNVGPGSEKAIYPDVDVNMKEGIPQAGAPEKEMFSHDEHEFSDEERAALKKLYSHGE